MNPHAISNLLNPKFVITQPMKIHLSGHKKSEHDSHGIIEDSLWQ